MRSWQMRVTRSWRKTVSCVWPAISKSGSKKAKSSTGLQLTSNFSGIITVFACAIECGVSHLRQSTFWSVWGQEETQSFPFQTVLVQASIELGDHFWYSGLEPWCCIYYVVLQMLLCFSETYHGSHGMTPTGPSGQIQGLSYELSVSLQLTSDTADKQTLYLPSHLPCSLLSPTLSICYSSQLRRIFSPFHQTYFYISSKSPSIQSHKPLASTQK